MTRAKWVVAFAAALFVAGPVAVLEVGLAWCWVNRKAVKEFVFGGPEIIAYVAPEHEPLSK